MHAPRILLALGLTATALLTGCSDPSTSDGTERDDSGEVVGDGDLGVFAIQVGDCFLDTVDGEMASVSAVPCTGLHDHEVFAKFDLPYPNGEAFPGQAAVEEESALECYARFEGFVGLSYEESIYDFGVITPTADSWDVNDREALCFISMYDGTQKTGSAEGTGV